MQVVAKTEWFAILQATPHDEIIATSRDEVLILAVDTDGSILLIEEFCPAVGAAQLLLPGGAVEDGEDVLVTAQRELREEAGFAANEMKLVASLRPWSKYLRVTSHVVLASGLYPSPLPQHEPSPVVMRRKTRTEVADLVARGDIRDARLIAALSLSPAEL